ncbi:hypothetical protein M3Y97_00087300 [Aphelenchoides bicaudatus]|nr:hypothetical protein M3Y97_00087300 [Aphelenchoides bicaudatus]
MNRLPLGPVEMVEVQQQCNNSENRKSTAADDTEIIDWDKKPLLDRSSFKTEFDTKAYLKDFYADVQDPAMQMMIRFLPGIAVRLPKAQTLLDFGCGPTIHVSVCFRNRVQRIYLADYLEQNREELHRWLNGQNEFDWQKTLKMIATCEGTEWSMLQKMEDDTKSKASMLDVSDRVYGSIDIVVTILTLEYCCNTLGEYKSAVKRVASLVKKNGYLIVGGLFEETWCSFGGRKFNCLYITKEYFFECLTEAGMVVDLENSKHTIMHEVNGMFLICAQKRAA